MIPTDVYPVVIQFGYRAHRGKDTACATILTDYGRQYSIRQYAYADAIRREVHDAVITHWTNTFHTNPFDDPIAAMALYCRHMGLLFDPTAKVEPGYRFTKQRAVYQWHGTEYRRKQDPFYWVNLMRADIERERPRIAVVSDLRFRNEFAYGQSANPSHPLTGYNVKLVRPDLDEQDDLAAAQSGHSSETELDSLPDSHWYRVITHTSVDDFKAQVRRLFNDIIAELTPPDMSEMFNDPSVLTKFVKAA